MYALLPTYVTTDYLQKPFKQGNDEPVGVFLSDEIVLRVAVYHHRRNIKFQEFLVLGSQPLTALKDVISCESDRDDMIEASNPCLGSFFFIHDTFYVDTRDPRNVDYSEYVYWFAVNINALND